MARGKEKNSHPSIPGLKVAHWCWYRVEVLHTSKHGTIEILPYSVSNTFRPRSPGIPLMPILTGTFRRMDYRNYVLSMLIGIVSDHIEIVSTNFLACRYHIESCRDRIEQISRLSISSRTASATAQHGPPSKAVVCQGNLTGLLREAALFIPGYECNSPVAPGCFDRLISGYRLKLLRPPYGGCISKLC